MASSRNWSLLAVVVLSTFWTTGAGATTYNTPTVDGLIQTPPESDADWDLDELLLVDPEGDSGWGACNDLTGLWVTWDAQGITFGVSGHIWNTGLPGCDANFGNSVNLFLDVDFGGNTGINDMSVIDADGTLGAIGRNLRRTLQVGGGFRADFGYTCWAGQFDLGFLDLSTPRAPTNRLAEIDEARDTTTRTGYELFVPWSVLYPDRDASTPVPPGTRIAAVVVQVGGGDSMSPESMPGGIDPDGGDRLLENSIAFTVDANGDGVPDRDWPPAGSIAGTVVLSDPVDETSVVDVVALLGATEVARTQTPPGGGEFVLERLPAGTYSLRFESDFYLAEDLTGIVLAENQDLVLPDPVTAIKINGGMQFSLQIVDGPEASSRTRRIVAFVTDVDPAELPALEIDPALTLEANLDRYADAFARDPLILQPGAPLANVFIRPLVDGSYWFVTFVVPHDADVQAGYTALGYEAATTPFVVDGDDITDIGTVSLQIVRATRLAYFAQAPTGASAITSAFTVVSLPAADFYAKLPLWVGFVDDQGHEAIFDTAVRGNVTLTATLMDPSFAPDGDVIFWSADGSSPVAQPLLSAGAWPVTPPSSRAPLQLSDDAQEVIRLVATHPTVASAVLEIGVVPREPAFIELIAGAAQTVAAVPVPLRAQLKDVSGNDSRIADVQITFDVDPPLGGAASVVPGTAVTNTDGAAGGTAGELEFVSTAVGTITITAFANVSTGQIQSEPIVIEVSPEAAHRLALRGRVADFGRIEGEVSLQDPFGNVVQDQPETVQLSFSPASLVASGPAAVQIDVSGTGAFTVDTNAGKFGVVEIEATLADLAEPTSQLLVEVLPGLAAADELAPETDDDHNADAGIDLTTVFAFAVNDTLEVRVPLVTAFDGAHVALILETRGDAFGLSTDVFEFPIDFAHANKPDAIFTFRLQGGDGPYADVRRQKPQAEGGTGAPGDYQWYDILGREWVDRAEGLANYRDGFRALDQGWVSRGASDVRFRLPLAVLGLTENDPLDLQVYAMQETEGNKRPALDSAPHDATVDMLPNNGGPWYENLPPRVTLANYGRVQIVETAKSLLLSDVAFDPPAVTQRELSLLTAVPRFRNQAPVGAILQVFADLRSLGGDEFTPLRDDGTNGDIAAGDGVYSLAWTVSSGRFPGDYAVVVRALEVTTGEQALARASLTVTGQPELEAIVEADDAIGDDHGPNLPGRQFLYYEYPTNGVFFDGVFDLRKLEVFDGEEQLILRVTVGELTDPSQPNAADWNATHPGQVCPPGNRVDLNLQNTVVLIDTGRGGSTNLPDTRYADVAIQDAWDVALVADGWWKGMVLSNNSSSFENWTTLQSDTEFFFCTDGASNTIDYFVSKERLGLADLSEADVRTRVQGWDFLVLMSGHDGDSNDRNWGGVRWVNEGSGSEWQFNGGRSGEDFRERDPNIIDVLIHVGTGKTRGRAQEEMMDFLTSEAVRRFAEGENAVVLEAEELIDTAPPQVTSLNVPGRAAVPWTILRDSPVVVQALVEDESAVEGVDVLWRGLGQPPSASRRTAMGLLRRDVDEDGMEWVADIRWEDLVAAGVTNPVPRQLDDGSVQIVRYMVLSFDPVDIFGNRPDPADAREYLLEIPQEPVERIVVEDLLSFTAADPVELRLPEGSRIRLDRAALEALGEDPVLDLIYEAPARGDLDLMPHGGGNETVLTASNRFLGTARRFTLEKVDGQTRTPIPRLGGRMEISIHFPRYEVLDTPAVDLRMFRYVPSTGRWVLVGGHGERDGSTVTVTTLDLGTYGLFTKGSQVDGEKLVTGLEISPNPFSPNGDNLYDTCQISYVLPDETSSAIVEIFDLRGERLRTLKLFEADDIINRTLGIEWDGQDEDGRVVPMGIYVVRVEVKAAQGGRVERQTKAVAVVR